MKYISKVITYTPKAELLAEKIVKAANEMEKENFELVSVTCTGTASAVLIFKGTQETIFKSIQENA